MTDLLHNATYDQIVLGICFAAVVVSGSMMHLSAHVGNIARGRRTSGPESAQRLKMHPVADTEAPAREKAA